MATTETYDWAPPFSDLIIAAYGRCQIRRNALTVEHLHDAAMAANLMQSDWSNEQVNLWTVSLQSITLVPGVATYDVDPTTVMIMAAYISTEQGPQKDRILNSIDRDTYASFPDKETVGSPTVYWYNAQRAPTITLWQPPDDKEPRILRFYCAKQQQDAEMKNGFEADVPYRFLEAYVAGLAFKLAELYAPPRMQELAAAAKSKFDRAKERDVENAPLRIVPAMSIYTRVVY